jgi:hypothetical protein
MAQLFLEEQRPGRGTSHSVPIELAIDKLTPFEKKYFDAPPEAHAAQVILRVDESEINAVFPEEGYYQVTGLTPEDCRGLFGLVQ